MQFKRAQTKAKETTAPEGKRLAAGSKEGLSELTRRLAMVGVISTASMFISPAAQAQGSPMPGNSSYSAPQPGLFDSAPIPGGNPQHQGATSTSNGAQRQPSKIDSIYSQLPLSAEEARIRLEDLSNRLAVSRPDEVKDSIYALSEWLQDVADAHWKMFKAFEKTDATKGQALKEKEIGLKFSALKNRAKLLKADLYIKQNRYPEALGPLVEIVVAEPTTATGQAAYKRLVDMGFSEQASTVELAQKSVPQKPTK